MKNKGKRLLSALIAAAMCITQVTSIFAEAENGAIAYGGGYDDISSYSYILTNMNYSNISGNALEEPVNSCFISLDVTKRKRFAPSALVIISVYSDSGKLIGMQMHNVNADLGETVSLPKTMIYTAEECVIGDIRAYAWENLGNVTPISNVLSRYSEYEITNPDIEVGEDMRLNEFSDVSMASKSADAITSVSSLGFMRGYEDGTFRPYEHITRAEAARMLVVASGAEKYARYLKDMTYFNDISASHWAVGYLNYCCAKGYIIPDSNGNANPDAYVTLGELMKLMLDAAGYNKFALSQGGYPMGYLHYAQQYDILNDIEIGINDVITREYAAMLIDSVLDIPCVQTSGYAYSATAGGNVPVEYIMDGNDSRSYKSLKTETFKVYTVWGYITDNSKSDFALSGDEVKIALSKSRYYDDDALRMYGTYTSITSMSAAMQMGTLLTVNIGETGAADLIGMHTKIDLFKDPDGNYIIFSIKPTGNSIITISADMLDTTELGYEDGRYRLTDLNGTSINYLKYFTSYSNAKSKKIMLQTNTYGSGIAVDVYVNGVKVAYRTDTDALVRRAIESWVLNNKNTEIRLVDTFQADGYYDAIYVDWYATAQIYSIGSRLALTNQKHFTNGNVASITLDPDDDILSYHIYYNGEEISISDLKVNDVISIAYDVTAGKFAQSSFYDIYVSRENVTDILIAIIADDEILEFSNAAYNLVDATEISSYSLGNEYTLYLDAFGRILDAEVVSTNEESVDVYGNKGFAVVSNPTNISDYSESDLISNIKDYSVGEGNDDCLVNDL